MDGTKALYYAAIALAVLIGISVAVNVVSAILGLVSTVASGIITLAVLAALGYATYKVGSWLLGGDDESIGTDALDSLGTDSSSASADGATSRQDRLREQYVEGQISEDEFERRIAEELETEEVDDIDRELERER